MDAALWLGGREYTAAGDGTITVPFSTAPGRQPVVISAGEFACLDVLDHQPEGYALQAGIHVDRECPDHPAGRPGAGPPGLFLNGQPVSLKLLEDVRLQIIATDHDGIPTSTEVPNFKLFEDRETVHEFRVPPRLASLQVGLLARVKSLSTNRTWTWRPARRSP